MNWRPRLGNKSRNGKTGRTRTAGGRRKRDARTGAAPVARDFLVRIHKSRGILELFRGNRLMRTIPVCTGKNHADKQREGDLATPEGEFYICYKNPRSRYLRFLGISYPNLEDAERGLRAGLISRVQFKQISAAIRRRECPPWK